MRRKDEDKAKKSMGRRKRQPKFNPWEGVEIVSGKREAPKQIDTVNYISQSIYSSHAFQTAIKRFHGLYDIIKNPEKKTSEIENALSILQSSLEGLPSHLRHALHGLSMSIYYCTTRNQRMSAYNGGLGEWVKGLIGIYQSITQKQVAVEELEAKAAELKEKAIPELVTVPVAETFSKAADIYVLADTWVKGTAVAASFQDLSLLVAMTSQQKIHFHPFSYKKMDMAYAFKEGVNPFLDLAEQEGKFRIAEALEFDVFKGNKDIKGLGFIINICIAHDDKMKEKLYNFFTQRILRRWATFYS